MKANIELVLQIIPLAISEYLNKKIVNVKKVILGVTNILKVVNAATSLALI